jgi:hypothetical protein
VREFVRWPTAALLGTLLLAVGAATSATAQDAALTAGSSFQVDLDRTAIRKRIRSLMELPLGETSWISTSVLGAYENGTFVNYFYPSGIFCVDGGQLKIFGGQEAPDPVTDMLELDYLGDSYQATRLDEYSIQLATFRWSETDIEHLVDAMSYPCGSTPFAPELLLDVASLVDLDEDSHGPANTFHSLAELADHVNAGEEGE